MLFLDLKTCPFCNSDMVTYKLRSDCSSINICISVFYNGFRITNNYITDYYSDLPDFKVVIRENLNRHPGKKLLVLEECSVDSLLSGKLFNLLFLL